MFFFTCFFICVIKYIYIYFQCLTCPPWELKKNAEEFDALIDASLAASSLGLDNLSPAAAIIRGLPCGLQVPRLAFIYPPAAWVPSFTTALDFGRRTDHAHWEWTSSGCPASVSSLSSHVSGCHPLLPYTSFCFWRIPGNAGKTKNADGALDRGGHCQIIIMIIITITAKGATIKLQSIVIFRIITSKRAWMFSSNMIYEK